MIGAEHMKSGFIADELIGVFPQCVAGEPGKIDKDGNPEYMMVDEAGLVSMLTKCIQGNREEIKELKRKNKHMIDKMYKIMMELNLD